MQIRSGPFIAAGQSISDVLPTDMLRPMIIITPAAWTAPANLRILFSPDNANFYPLCMENHIWEAVCLPNSAIRLGAREWPTYSFFKFVSSSGGSEVPQQEDRWFQMVGDT